MQTAEDATRIRQQREPGFGGYAVLSDLIVDEEDVQGLGRRNLVQRVVPGDVFFYGDEPTNLDHLAIVQSVQYDEDGWANIESIRLIESTYMPAGNAAGRPMIQSVINNQTLGADYSEDTWRLVRLRSR